MPPAAMMIRSDPPLDFLHLRIHAQRLRFVNRRAKGRDALSCVPGPPCARSQV